MRLLICAGGTGGGVYPALAVLQALTNEAGEVLWVGGRGGMEADLVRRAGVRFHGIPAAGLHGVGPRALPGNLIRLGLGLLAARSVLGYFKPQVLFFTGGYVAVPMALAGRRVPSLVFVPDVEPALALKTLARFADRIALAVEASRAYFPPQARLTVTGYPVRQELAGWDRARARRALSLSADRPTLLVFGGSKGARSINQALLADLPALLTDMQVIHLAGSLDWPEVEARRARLPARYADRYRAYPYLHAKMGAALAAADLALSRAGASALGEFPQFGLPAILVPYPHAWRYQRVNAQYLADRGAAVVIEDAVLRGSLAATVREVMGDEGRRARMRAAMRALAVPDAAERIAAQLRALAGDAEVRGRPLW